jgi:hypothetical protein
VSFPFIDRPTLKQPDVTSKIGTVAVLVLIAKSTVFRVGSVDTFKMHFIIINAFIQVNNDWLANRG